MTLRSVNLWSEEKQESLEPVAELKGDLDWFVNMALPLPVGETVSFVLDLPGIYGEIPRGEYLLGFSIWDHLGADSASYYPYDRMNYWGYSVPLTIE